MLSHQPNAATRPLHAGRQQGLAEADSPHQGPPDFPDVPTSVLKPAGPLWTREFVFLLAATLTFFLGFHLILPTSPLHSVSLGGSEVTAGLVTGFFSLAALLSRPLSGWLLDVRSRRGVLLLGTAVCLVVIAAHALVGSVALLLVLRVLHGVGFAVATTATGTLGSDLVPRARLGQGLGYLAVAMGLPMAVSPAVGIWLAGRDQFGLLFGLAGLLTALSLILAAGLKPPRARAMPALRRASLVTHLFERSALLPSTLIFLLVSATGVITALLALYGEERGIASAGIFFTAYALVLSVMRSLAGGAADRWGYELLAGAGLVFAIAGVLVISLAGNLAVLLVAAVLYAVGFGMAQPSLQALAVLGAPVSRRGAATASFYTAFDLGMGVGSLAAGFLAGALLSMSAVFALAAVLPLAALLLLGGQQLRQRRRR